MPKAAEMEIASLAWSRQPTNTFVLPKLGTDDETFSTSGWHREVVIMLEG